MANNDNVLNNKVSNHIQHQLPEFIQADHPVFSKFVKFYYQFLESAEITFSEVNNYVREETTSVNFILDEDGDQIVLEDSDVKFDVGEVITGQTSGAQGNITQYRGNPIQNIQQLLEYADVDNTIFDFLNQMRESFMTAIPNSLATSVSKRKLLKNIKDLYAAKGTREATELFFRILLGEEANVFYPTEHMLRVSNGDWRAETTLRCSGFTG